MHKKNYMYIKRVYTKLLNEKEIVSAVPPIQMKILYFY